MLPGPCGRLAGSLWDARKGAKYYASLSNDRRRFLLEEGARAAHLDAVENLVQKTIKVTGCDEVEARKIVAKTLGKL